MSFSFTQRTKTSAQVRTIAQKQLHKALALAESGKASDKAVHALRRRCKKLRGLLRLVRPNFEQFQSTNAALRDAAGALSARRDAAVTLETFDLLMRTPWAGDLSWDRKTALRTLLEHNIQEAARVEGQDGLLDTFAQAMKSQVKQVGDWSLDGYGFDLLAEGLRDNYAAMAKRMKQAAKSNAAADFHEWRKSTKVHGVHTALLTPSAPRILADRRRHLKALGDLLGDHHNIAVLTDALSAHAGTLEPALAEGLASEQQVLAEQALMLGRELCAEKPAALVSRLHQFWKLLPGDN